MNRDATHPPPAAPAPLPADTGREALAWAVASGMAEKVVTQVRVRRRRRQRRVVAALGGAAALLVAAFWWRAPSALTGDPAPGAAVVSAPARQVLADGSVVELKEGATIAVAFEPGLRRVVLQAGEAHFSVQKDAARPFVVAVGGVEVRAVGTAFSVHLGTGAVDVLVTEGRVAIEKVAGVPAPVSSSAVPAAAPEPPEPVAYVDAGNRIAMPIATAAPAPASPPADTGRVVAVTAAEQEERLAWRVPRLEFAGTPLSEAIPMFRDYGRVKLVLDPALGKLRVSGLLRADDTDSLLLLLKNEFGIEAERRPGGELFLRRR